MHPGVRNFSPSAWPSMQSPAQAFMSSPATNSPSQIGYSHMGPDSPYHDQPSTFYDMIMALENLLSLGLNHYQISCLCKPKNFNQLSKIADADGNVLQAAWDSVNQKLASSKTRKLSHGPTMLYRSGVPSLESNPSQWSASTDQSTSTAEPYTPGFANLFEGQPHSSKWHTVSGEMDAMIPGDSAIHGNGTAMTFTGSNFEQPQPPDLHQSANANTGMASVYLPRAPVDVPSLSGSGNAGVSYFAPNSGSYYSTCVKTTQENGRLAGSTDSTQQLGRQRTVKKDNIKHPCSEPDCQKGFMRSVELGKHLQGDHEKNNLYICQHDDKCTVQTHRHATWARHHSKDHDACKKGDTCVKSIPIRKKRYWGCSICVHLSEDVSSHATHHLSHFKDGAAHAHDIKYSTMIVSLLLQEATKDKWEAYCSAMGIQAGNCDPAWQPSRCEGIRRALEDGKYQGADISDPFVADQLLAAVYTWMFGKRKWDTAGISSFDNFPDPQNSWLDVNPRKEYTSFLDTSDVEFNGNY